MWFNTFFCDSMHLIYMHSNSYKCTPKCLESSQPLFPYFLQHQTLSCHFLDPDSTNISTSIAHRFPRLLFSHYCSKYIIPIYSFSSFVTFFSVLLCSSPFHCWVQLVHSLFLLLYFFSTKMSVWFFHTSFNSLLELYIFSFVSKISILKTLSS